MQFVAVVVATLAAYAFGAFWYIRMSKPWIKAAGIPVDAEGKPQGNGSLMPFIVGFVCVLVVAGMMRHIFAMSGLQSVLEGLMGGFGIGAFLVTPWVVMNYTYAARPRALAMIDGVYSVVGCTIIGVVLTLF
jgi:hypothetical protein